MKNYDDLINSIKNYQAFLGDILLNEQLSTKTTFKIGSTCDLFIAPQNYYSFQIALSNLIKYNIKFFILGGGSNVVFPDENVNYVILSTQNFSNIDKLKSDECPLDFGKVTLNDNEVLVTCFSGTPMAALVNYCIEHNISGLEQFAGLPGSVGGALYMNARCFEKSISDVIFYTTHMDFSSDKVILNHKKFDSNEWDYKKSPFQNKNIFITTGTFLLKQKTEKDHEQIQMECKKYINERVTKGHFKFPSAGSVFKNNHNFGKPSGKIIDECGLRGKQMGGAKIADFHGNFIINVSNAKAQDVRNLVEFTQKEIFKKLNFSLEPEIIFVDKD